MRALRTLRGQLALIVLIAILIPVAVMGYYALEFELADKNLAAATEAQLQRAAGDLVPLLKDIGAGDKENELAKLSPAISEAVRAYPGIKVSVFNGSTIYSFPGPGPGKRPGPDFLIVNVPSQDQLLELRSLTISGPVVRPKQVNYPAQPVIESITPIGKDRQGLLILEARMGQFFLEARQARLGIGFSLLLGLLVGIAGILWISHRLSLRISRIQGGLQRVAADLDIPLAEESGELGLIVKAINSMRLELKDKRELEDKLHRAERLAGLGQLVAGVAHEIRNPLGIIKGTVQLMERDLEAPLSRYQEHLKIVNEQVNRQNRVVEELLSYARPLKPQLGPVSVGKVLDSVLAFMGPSLSQSGISVDKQFPLELPLVKGDGEKLKQVFVNLLLNCKEALSQGGHISIEARTAGQWLEAVIRDNGPGIPPEQLERIFEPFFSTKEAGTGLGLSIAKQLVEQHKGELVANSEPGNGTEFILRIPLEVNGFELNSDN